MGRSMAFTEYKRARRTQITTESEAVYVEKKVEEMDIRISRIALACFSVNISWAAMILDSLDLNLMPSILPSIRHAFGVKADHTGKCKVPV